MVLDPYQRPVRPTDRDQIVGQLISITSTTSRRHPASQLGENFLAPPLKPPPNNSCRNRSGDPHWTEGVVPSLAESDNGSRHRVENTAELRAWVLDLAGQIRAARARRGEVIPVNPRPGRCRSCGVRGHCGQARL